MGTLHKDLCTLMIISRWIIFKTRNFKTKLVEKTKTRIFSSLTFFQKSCRLWYKMEKYGTARQATDDYNTVQKT
jgi:hypothetical protein